MKTEILKKQMEVIEEIQRETAEKTLDHVLGIIEKRMEMNAKVRRSKESLNILQLAVGDKFKRLYDLRQIVSEHYFTLYHLYDEISQIRFGE